MDISGHGIYRTATIYICIHFFNNWSNVSARRVHARIGDLAKLPKKLQVSFFNNFMGYGEYSVDSVRFSRRLSFSVGEELVIQPIPKSAVHFVM